MADVNAVLEAADAGLETSLERLFEILRIPSISTDPTYAPDCRNAAQWAVDELNEMGFEASLRDTPGQPMVVAHFRRKEGKSAPHVLFYGHYDVQPADPLEKWTSPPFEPERKKDKDGVER